MAKPKTPAAILAEIETLEAAVASRKATLAALTSEIPSDGVSLAEQAAAAATQAQVQPDPATEASPENLPEADPEAPVEAPAAPVLVAHRHPVRHGFGTVTDFRRGSR